MTRLEAKLSTLNNSQFEQLSEAVVHDIDLLTSGHIYVQVNKALRKAIVTEMEKRVKQGIETTLDNYLNHIVG